MRFRRLATLATVLGTASLLSTRAASAQHQTPVAPPSSDYIRAYRPTAFIPANGLINGSLAALGALRNHEAVGPAFLRGTIGGLLVGGGKYAAAKNFDLVFVGRVLGSLGNAMTANAMHGELSVNGAHLDVGPVTFRYDASARYGVGAALIPETMIDMVIAGFRYDHLRTDLSWKAGTLVYESDVGGQLAGLSVSSLVRVQRIPRSGFLPIECGEDRCAMRYDNAVQRSVVTHEVGGHLMQQGQVVLFLDAMNNRATEGIRGWAHAHYLDVDGMLTLPFELGRYLLPPDARFDETEARSIEGLGKNGLSIATRVTPPRTP